MTDNEVNQILFMLGFAGFMMVFVWAVVKLNERSLKNLDKKTRAQTSSKTASSGTDSNYGSDAVMTFAAASSVSDSSCSGGSEGGGGGGGGGGE